jgi:hypothetical protein
LTPAGRQPAAALRRASASTVRGAAITRAGETYWGVFQIVSPFPQARPATEEVAVARLRIAYGREAVGSPPSSQKPKSSSISAPWADREVGQRQRTTFGACCPRLPPAWRGARRSGDRARDLAPARLDQLRGTAREPRDAGAATFLGIIPGTAVAGAGKGPACHGKDTRPERPGNCDPC